MSNSRITTKSYAIKRLKDCGYSVDVTQLSQLEYAENDPRKWTILVDNGVASILVTCFKDSTIQLYDGGRFMNPLIRLNTESVEVLVEYLNSRGIVNKHYTYGKNYTATE